ncbi:MAG: ribbon-helix-helix domain-containing protein [Methyloceanibacter sp.]
MTYSGYRRPCRISERSQILLNLPKQILEEVDLAVREQGVTRSQFLRQAIERNLRHYQNVERAIFRRIYQQGMS